MLTRRLTIQYDNSLNLEGVITWYVQGNQIDKRVFGQRSLKFCGLPRGLNSWSCNTDGMLQPADLWSHTWLDLGICGFKSFSKKWIFNQRPSLHLSWVVKGSWLTDAFISIVKAYTHFIPAVVLALNTVADSCKRRIFVLNPKNVTGNT